LIAKWRESGAANKLFKTWTLKTNEALGFTNLDISLYEARRWPKKTALNPSFSSISHKNCAENCT
jgi:hypothetical protein